MSWFPTPLEMEYLFRSLSIPAQFLLPSDSWQHYHPATQDLTSNFNHKLTMGVAELRAKLFARQAFVCGGHGARWARHSHHFTVPAGITIHFYCHDKESLPNDIGQKVDAILSGGTPPGSVSTYASGQRCWDYRLFSSRAGGYLNLSMSSEANDRYITTKDKDTGIKLSSICETVIKTCPNADLHWSACRAIEDKNDVVDWSKPEYDQSPALQKLSKKAK